jgi:tetratricopeptide (TPR) repeat protein
MQDVEAIERHFEKGIRFVDYPLVSQTYSYFLQARARRTLAAGTLSYMPEPDRLRALQDAIYAVALAGRATSKGGSARDWIALGEAQVLKSEVEKSTSIGEAIDSYTTAIEIESDNPLPYLLMAQAYATISDIEKARTWAQKSLEVRPSYEEGERFMKVLEGG